VRFVADLLRNLLHNKSTTNCAVAQLRNILTLCQDVAQGVRFVTDRVKPRPHQQQCRSYIVECCYKVECCFDKVESCFDIVAVFGNNVERVFRKILSFSQSRNKLNTFTLFDFVEGTKFRSTLLWKNGNNVEAKFDFYRINSRLCCKNRSTCGIRRCCFDIVANVDGVLAGKVMFSVVFVCPFISIYLSKNWPLTLTFCSCMGHDHCRGLKVKVTGQGKPQNP